MGGRRPAVDPQSPNAREGNAHLIAPGEQETDLGYQPPALFEHRRRWHHAVRPAKQRAYRTVNAELHAGGIGHPDHVAVRQLVIDRHVADEQPVVERYSVGYCDSLAFDDGHIAGAGRADEYANCRRQLGGGPGCGEPFGSDKQSRARGQSGRHRQGVAQSRGGDGDAACGNV